MISWIGEALGDWYWDCWIAFGLFGVGCWIAARIEKYRLYKLLRETTISGPRAWSSGGTYTDCITVERGRGVDVDLVCPELNCDSRFVCSNVVRINSTICVKHRCELVDASS